MAEIHVLPENLANRIAAGEVVERPGSVVKELLENSIDAGAGRIEVILREGGKKLIEVRDDGNGMTEHDVVLAVQRFATSKIADQADLDAITTMGFRGEALPSIGAVAQMKITSRPHDSATGTALLMEGGEATDIRAVGCPPGTTVQVANLFYNTPARRKFLATSATERGHCLDWVCRLALAHPEIAFHVTHNDSVVLSTPGSDDMRSVLAAVYGSDTARHLLPVHFEAEGLVIHGFVSTPQVTRATRRHQLFFVNHRFIRSRMLSHALTEAYGMLLPMGKQPLAVIGLEIDPHQIDPNVHPTKIEVRFKSSGEVHNLLQQAVEKALAEGGYRSLTKSERRQAPQTRSSSLPAGRLEPPKFAEVGQIKRLRVNPFFDQVDERDEGLEVHAQPAELAEETAPALPSEPEQRAPEASMAVFGQLNATYLVVQRGEDLLLVDQHRAAERVIFERLLSQPRRLSRQLLAVPITLELVPEEAAAVEEYQKLLSEAGFEMEPFGASSYLVRSVPSQVAGSNPEEVMQAMIADLATWQGTAELENRREAMLAMVACHSAIKAGERLSDQEMTQLVTDLMRTQTPATCPHGDPVIVSLEATQINRKFNRS